MNPIPLIPEQSFRLFTNWYHLKFGRGRYSEILNPSFSVGECAGRLVPVSPILPMRAHGYKVLLQAGCVDMHINSFGEF